ncbi:MAG: AraC family transcriptional regulator [Bulleidia sp.]
MTPEELDQKLKALTEHEKLYKEGYHNPKSDSFPSALISGKKVMQFSYSLISAENNGIPFLVKKHSRFRDYPYHIHDWIELSYMYAGKSVQVIGDEEHVLEKGQLLLMSPDVVHTLKPLKTEDILVQIAIGQSNLNNNFFSRLSSASIISDFLINAFARRKNTDQFCLFHSEHSRWLRLFISEFLCEWYEPSLATLDIQNDLFSLIISELINVMPSESAAAPQYQNEHILPVLHYIESNYRDCSLESAAESFSLHPNYLSSLLKRSTGYTFNELVQKERISAAERLLTNSEMTVTEIASMVGYQNMSYFYRIFRNSTGCKPGQYRLQHRRR